jgi:hypothetical protein
VIGLLAVVVVVGFGLIVVVEIGLVVVAEIGFAVRKSVDRIGMVVVVAIAVRVRMKQPVLFLLMDQKMLSYLNLIMK